MKRLMKGAEEASHDSRMELLEAVAKGIGWRASMVGTAKARVMVWA